jgi:hypothetical protein
MASVPLLATLTSGYACSPARNNCSAKGDLQMLPVHTVRIENSLTVEPPV